jgi:peptide deformylase
MLKEKNRSRSMPVREIITPPNPVLRDKARRIGAIGSATQQLIEDMIDTMRAAPGVGLAAPQVNISQRVIVVEFGEEPQSDGEAPRPPRLYAVVNPEIVRHSTETEIGSEGCLSLPGYLGEVERYQWVTVRGLDRRGNPFKLKARGWLARIFQHEIDHLDGILFIDRATTVWRVEDAQLAESAGRPPVGGPAD